MSFDDRSLTKAVKEKAAAGRAKARQAEKLLAAANDELEAAIEHGELGKAKLARERTVAAEEEVAAAAHEMELVESLVDPDYFGQSRKDWTDD